EIIIRAKAQCSGFGLLSMGRVWRRRTPWVRRAPERVCGVRTHTVFSHRGGMGPSLAHQRLIRLTDTAFNIVAELIIDGIGIPRIGNIGLDKPLLGTRYPVLPATAL